VIAIAFGLLAIPVFLAIVEWRLAFLLCLATGILQDPLRKLTPNKPVFFVVFVGVVFAGMCLGAFVRGVPLSPNNIFRRYSRLTSPFFILLLLIIVQAFNSYLRFGNLMLTSMGVLTYLLPLPAIVCIYQLVSRQGVFRMNQFMKWYVVAAFLALTTVYLEYSGYDWPVLGTVGPQLIIFDHYTGRIMFTFAGIFRAPEIAAWHAMAAASLFMLINFSRTITFRRVLTVAIVTALLVGLGILTGRRKIIVELAVFIGTYFILWGIFERGVGKLVITTLTCIAVIGYSWMATLLREDVKERRDTGLSSYSRYVDHTEDAFQEAPSRFVELGIAPVMWAYDSFGVLGAGLGAGTQGTQHFGGGGAIAGAAEGGLGKITLELGIPGLFVVGWIAILAYRYCWRIMIFASRHSRRMARLSFGIFSFLVANLAGFSVATQAFGDLFILLILSWTIGFLFAVPVLIEREVRARQVASFGQLAPALQKTV